MNQPEHLTENELIRFYRGELNAKEGRRVVRHLLTGCPSCRERAAGRWQTEVEPRQSDDENGFEEIFERAARASIRLGNTIDSERREAPALLAELLHHPLERQKLLVANSLRFRSYGLVEAVLEAAFRGGFNDPRQAIDQAELAVTMAQEISEETYGARLVSDLQARAWGTLGNAQRIASRLLDAESSLRKSFDLADRGTGDPAERARLLSFLASLRSDQCRFDEALTLHRQMTKIYETLGDRHLLGRTTEQMAFVLRRKGDFQEAIDHSERALADLDPERDLRAVLVARQGLTNALFEVGRFEEASKQCVGLRREWTELGNDLDALRCDWTLGQILHRQGRLRQAETRFRDVRDRFIKLEIPYDAALVSLDLAETLFDQGKTAAMGRRLAEAIPIFRDLGIHREAIAALAFLRQAAEVEQATVGLIRATARFVEESSKNPELRFRSTALSADS